MSTITRWTLILTLFTMANCGSSSGPALDGGHSRTDAPVPDGTNHTGDFVVGTDIVSGDTHDLDLLVDQGIADIVADAITDAPQSPLDEGVSLPDTSSMDATGDLSDGIEDSGTVVDVTQDVVPDVPAPNPALWLLSIDNGAHKLQRINVETGESTDLCTLNTFNSYPSLTFSRSNRLFASRDGGILDEIDPCTCAITEIGSYNGFSGVYGITSDQGFQLYGVATTQDAAITIDTNSGQGTLLGYLGVDYTSSGATWSDANNTLFAINSKDDTLCEINADTGESTVLANLSMSFGTVGIELHPSSNNLYACTDDAHLRLIDKETGVVTVIGDMNQIGSCTNLAAPWYDISCISPNTIP